MNIRNTVLTACLVGSGYFAPALAATPDVTGLRADIYSTNSAELFWDRVPNQALTYEILRNDGQLSTTDGTSFYDSTRSPGVTSDYAVTAIDSDGVRSTTATTTVAPFDQVSLQPLHLRGDVYSSTTAEILWVRVPNRDLSYEVERDGVVMSVTHGNSYYDSARTSGAPNTYTVTTIDELGIRHLPATLTLGLFGTESIDSPPATGLKSSVYSATAAEIHWDRVPNRDLRYELLRDDGLSNISNGTSYYDNKRFPGTSNTYIITTIDEEGNRSSAVSIDVPAG
ncbi:hypothetical protein [Granulosicoccus antarcticus]|uniref:Fibronectin type-III domain-containing protein n=1 Tax=Granulosicoccus antarcticus IMCC3135 TaxID=1192854 RepID=A0A2Z2NX13_9GAMM|nr:hypothetical protein [Granulosicoccus antarcticus]ASJ72277.1 hypothetical protein IMCC3135_10925 [Granulosicoccus antarcticus IMCC3135]